MAGNVGMGADTPQNGNESMGTPQDAIDMMENMFTPEDGNVDEPLETEETEAEEGTEDAVEDAESVTDDEEENTPPKKYAGMYDKVEDLEKSYKTLQTAYQKLKETKTRESLNEVMQPTNPVAPPMQNLDPAMVQKAFQENPAGTIQMLVQAGIQQAMAPVQRQTVNAELATFKMDNPDFEEYAPRVLEILKENPEIINSKNRLAIAYKLAKAEQGESLTKKALENGIKQGYQNAVQKKAVSTSGKSGAGPKAPPKSAADSIADDIMAEAGRRNPFF